MRSFARRLAAVEAQLTPRPKHRWRVVWVARLDENRRHALAPGERIVLDHYGQCAEVILARERITTDPLDNGQPCPLKEDE